MINPLYPLGGVTATAAAGFAVLAYAVFLGELGGVHAVAVLLLSAAIVCGLALGMLVVYHLNSIVGEAGLWAVED